MSELPEHKFLMNDYNERQKATTAFVNSGYTVRVEKIKSDKYKYLGTDYDYYIIIQNAQIEKGE